MSIACGHCKGRHSSVADVRNCSSADWSARRGSVVQQPVVVAERPQLFAEPAPIVDERLTGPAAVAYFRALDAFQPHAGTAAQRRVLQAELDRLYTALERERATAAPVAQPRAPFSYNLPVGPQIVAAGYYAVASRTGNNDLDFFRVDRPTDGRWAGRTFVKRVIGGKPDSPVRGDTARAALQAILAAGERAASERYGRELGQCGRCNRHLTDELSRSRGFGSDCFGKL